MRIFRNFKLWTGLLATSLLVLIVVFAFVARRPLCIDSKLVERVDSISDSGTATAYRCGLHRHVEYDGQLAEQSKELGRRLQKLERYLEWIGPLKERVRISILQGEGNRFRIQGHELYLSESILKSTGQLEKAVLKIWFRERTHIELQAQELIEESLTDFLYFSLSGDLDLQDPKTGLYLNQDSNAKWPQVLGNLKSYCRSVWLRTEDAKICEEPELLVQEEILIQTLRPLITQALIESYEKIEASEQLLFLKGISTALAGLSFQEKNFGLTSASSSRQNFHEAISQIENWTYFLSELQLPELIDQKFPTLFEISLKGRGFDENSAEPNLDVLIFAEALSERQTQDLQKELEKNTALLIGLESRDQIQMNFMAEPLRLKTLGPMKATTGILLHCGTLDSLRLTRLAKKVQKLLYVNSCWDQKIRLSGFLKDGIKSFAIQNPDLKFAQFHMPSLLMALPKIPGQNPLYLISANKKESLKTLGWQDPSFDKTIGAYRAQSAIEIVDWFRL